MSRRHTKGNMPSCNRRPPMRLLRVAVIAVAALLATALSGAANAAENAIISRDAEVDGGRLHYMTAGHGTPLILLHG